MFSTPPVEMFPNLDFPQFECSQCTKSHFDCTDDDKNRLIEALGAADSQTVHTIARSIISKILRDISDRDNCDKIETLTRIKKLTSETEAANVQINNSERVVAGLQQEIEKLEPLLRQLEEKESKTEDLQQQVELTNCGLASPVNEENANVERQELDTPREGNVLALLGQIREQQKEIADLKQGIDDRNWRIFQREQSIERLSQATGVDALTNQLEAKDDKIETLMREIDEGNSRLLVREKEINDLQKQINEKDCEKDNLQRQIGARNSQILGRDYVIKELHEKVEQMKSRLEATDVTTPGMDRKRARTEASARD
ncbi:hypothetical protein BU16DRAFT_543660 [Lophium mytilinum]|uniref:Uncharacterized protein n=1 Tax=Lophium mytilinum TaxID=390894 RepID=A0A6A6QFD0_9PEZI|nr:hypothetical protein BU16DRAFT_543660 [Lophium mytilinum]